MTGQRQPLALRQPCAGCYRASDALTRSTHLPPPSSGSQRRTQALQRAGGKEATP